MKTLVVALGGNALLQRGEALTAENQYRNIASAATRAARLARSYRLAIVHGNGPQVGLLALQNLAWKEVEPIRWMCWWQKVRGSLAIRWREFFERTAADAARDDGADAH